MIMRELSLSPFLVDIGMGSNQTMLEVWTVKDGIWYHITFMAPADKVSSILTYCTANDQLISDFNLVISNVLNLWFSIIQNSPSSSWLRKNRSWK
jgi:hypothetical protein